MPYLPVDLDGKRKAEEVERALGLPRLSIVGGNVDLWEAVWRAWSGGKSPEEAQYVDDLALCSAYGPDPRIRTALVARDFLEVAGERHRVRGAMKWLFGLEGKKRGGKSSKGNLMRGGQPGVQPGTETSLEEDSPAKPGPMPGPMPEVTSGSNPGSFTQHPAPSTQLQKPLSDESDPPGPEALEVFKYWVERTGRTARTFFLGKRKRNVKARLKDGYSVEDLKSAVDGCAQTPHNQGNNDRGEAYDDLELICRGPEQVDRFIRNAKSPPRVKSQSGRASESDKDWTGVPAGPDYDEPFEAAS